ncbi:MAG: L-rhamnose mutarotase [Ferruginibacter sp.]
MQRIAFKMKLFKGCEEEYKKRHDEIWPELKLLFDKKGVHSFSIFLDEETTVLFAYLQVDDATKLDDLPKESIQQKW